MERRLSAIMAADVVGYSRLMGANEVSTLAQYNVACAWAMLGEVERSLDVLEGWARRGGVLARNWLERDPDLDAIRSHPRYAKLLETIAAGEGVKA